jgi:DNA-binding NarL/FixJ family response regulator
MPDRLEQQLYQQRLLRKSLAINTARLARTCAGIREDAGLLRDGTARGASETPTAQLNGHATVVEPLTTAAGHSHAELAPLTKREVAVLKLIAQGYSSKEVAHKLGITFKTASCHRFNLMQKLKVRETATLVRIAIRNGLIQP